MFWHYIDRKWWLFTILGVIYLYLESSFAISLLNAIRMDTIHTYENMDKIGRTLSGVGAALLTCKAVCNSNINKKSILCIVLGAISFGMIYKGQEKAVELLKEHTPQPFKEQVYDGYTFHRAATSGAYNLYKARLTGAGVPSYVETSFWGTYGFHAIFSEGTRNQSTAQRISLKVFDKDFQANSNFYYKKYLKANVGVQESLDAYFIIKKEIEKEIEQQSLESYNKVRKEYNDLPRYVRTQMGSKVMSEVRQKVLNQAGFLLPTDWKVNDRIAFRHYFQKHHKSKTLSTKLSDEYFALTGVLVRGNLSNQSELFSQKNFKDKLKTELKLFDTDNGFLRGLNETEFNKAYKNYIPTNLSKLYAEGKRSEQSLNTVFTLSVVPLLAISFSLVFLCLNFGSLMHSLVLEIVYLGEKRFSAHVVRMVIMSAIVFVPIYSTNALNIDPFYSQNLASLVNATSPLMGMFYSWITSISMSVIAILGDFHIDLFNLL